jgi:hypothetical protein
MKHLQGAVFAGALMVALFVSYPALAYPPVTNIYPGTTCRAIHAPGYDTYFDPNGHGANGFQNTSSKVRYAVCPITRDYMTASNLAHVTTYITSASIVVRNGTTCDILTQPWTGAWSTTFPADSTSNPNASVSVHRFGVSYNWIALSPYMSAVFFCRVPAGGIIHNYVVNESHDPS